MKLQISIWMPFWQHFGVQIVMKKVHCLKKFLRAIFSLAISKRKQRKLKTYWFFKQFHLKCMQWTSFSQTRHQTTAEKTFKLIFSFPCWAWSIFSWMRGAQVGWWSRYMQGWGNRGQLDGWICYYSATKRYTYGHFLTQWNLSLRYIISSKLLVWP